MQQTCCVYFLAHWQDFSFIVNAVDCKMRSHRRLLTPQRLTPSRPQAVRKWSRHMLVPIACCPLLVGAPSWYPHNQSENWSDGNRTPAECKTRQTCPSSGAHGATRPPPAVWDGPLCLLTSSSLLLVPTLAYQLDSSRMAASSWRPPRLPKTGPRLSRAGRAAGTLAAGAAAAGAAYFAAERALLETVPYGPDGGRQRGPVSLWVALLGGWAEQFGRKSLHASATLLALTGHPEVLHQVRGSSNGLLPASTAGSCVLLHPTLLRCSWAVTP